MSHGVLCLVTALSLCSRCRDRRASQVLYVVLFGSVGGVEAVEHTGSRKGFAARHARWPAPDACRLQDGRGHIDHAAELMAQTALFRTGASVTIVCCACRPSATPPACSLVRCVHCPCPAHRVVIVRVGCAKFIHVGDHESGVSMAAMPSQVCHLVERAV